MNRLIIAFFLTMVLLCGIIPFAHCDGAVSHTFEVQGAKMVSEGAYFWFEVFGYRQSYAGYFCDQGNFSVVFDSDFQLVKVILNGVPTNITADWLATDCSLMIVKFNMELDPNVKAELLFIAPSIGLNEMYMVNEFQFNKIDGNGEWEDHIYFNVQVLSLETYAIEVNPLIGELQRENNFVNMKISAILNETGFDWNAFCNRNSFPYDYNHQYNFTSDFLDKHSTTATVQIITVDITAILYLIITLLGVGIIAFGIFLMRKRSQR